MRYYPVNLDINKKRCVVVGGGSVGTRKVRTLMECGAEVSVVSPVASDRLRQLAEESKIVLHLRRYSSSDLDGAFLVIGATDDEELNSRISKDAEKLGMLCNIADRPEVCNFILPSIIKKGDLVLAISTSGQSPAFAKKLRKKLEKEFGDEYAIFLELMGAVRKKLLAEAHEPEAHKPIFEELIRSPIMEYIREKDAERINSVLREVLGDGYRFEELIAENG